MAGKPHELIALPSFININPGTKILLGDGVQLGRFNGTHVGLPPEAAYSTETIRVELTVSEPMLLIPESLFDKFCNSLGLPVIHKKELVDGGSDGERPKNESSTVTPFPTRPN